MTKKITFILPAEVVANATSGLLLGDFNNWDNAKAPNLKKQKDGSMKVTLALEGGRSYHYRYLLDDGRWVNDYSAETYVHDWRYGVDNCLITVPAEVSANEIAATETLPKKDDLTKIEGIGKAKCSLGIEVANVFLLQTQYWFSCCRRNHTLSFCIRCPFERQQIAISLSFFNNRSSRATKTST